MHVIAATNIDQVTNLNTTGLDGSELQLEGPGDGTDAHGGAPRTNGSGSLWED